MLDLEYHINEMSVLDFRSRKVRDDEMDARGTALWNLSIRLRRNEGARLQLKTISLGKRSALFPREGAGRKLTKSQCGSLRSFCWTALSRPIARRYQVCRPWPTPHLPAEQSCWLTDMLLRLCAVDEGGLEDRQILSWCAASPLSPPRPPRPNKRVRNLMEEIILRSKRH